MTTSEQQAVPVAQSPASIWLSPICDETAYHGEVRTWANPAPAVACDECGEPWVEYVRADLAPRSDATQTREAEGVHWRTDVEAAPRDGTRIILMWHDHESLSPHVELGKMGCGGKGWCNTYGHAFGVGEPTHWMPLPDAGSAVLNARGGA